MYCIGVLRDIAARTSLAGSPWLEGPMHTGTGSRLSICQ